MTSLTTKLKRFIYFLFYRFIYGQDSLLARKLTPVIQKLETRRANDIPISEDAWENQYLSDKWKFLVKVDELSRYSIIIGYLQHLKPGGAVLDVGCGEGVLFERLRPYGYSRYVGNDISRTSLASLMEKQDDKTSFIHCDAENYTPDEQFDVIIFNESLYYFHNPIEAVERYAHALNKGGILVVSGYKGSERAMYIRRKLKEIYPLLDETCTTHEQTAKSWICSVYTPVTVTH